MTRFSSVFVLLVFLLRKVSRLRKQGIWQKGAQRKAALIFGKSETEGLAKETWERQSVRRTCWRSWRVPDRRGCCPPPVGWGAGLLGALEGRGGFPTTGPADPQLSSTPGPSGAGCHTGSALSQQTFIKHLLWARGCRLC